MEVQNKPKQVKGRRKAPSSAWKPGQSGNPGGRPKIAAEVRELARRYGPEAIVRLVTLMRSNNETVAARAAEALLDRAYGRPLQGLEVSQVETEEKQPSYAVVFIPSPKSNHAPSVPDNPAPNRIGQLTYAPGVSSDEDTRRDDGSPLANYVTGRVW